MDARPNGRDVSDIDAGWARLSRSIAAEQASCARPALSDFERWVITVLVVIHVVAAASVAVARVRADQRERTG